MSRVKPRKEIIHEPSALEVLSCLFDMPTWVSILCKFKDDDKHYKSFLKYLTDVYDGSQSNEKVSIKSLASKSGYKTSQITKWVKEIYFDIIELNNSNHELFKSTGYFHVSLYMEYYDNNCTMEVSLPIIPRKYEQFRFPFIKAKIGTDYFWVSNVDYLLADNDTSITIRLLGGFTNIYKEFIIDKAMFEKKLTLSDVYGLHDFEINEKLKQLYK